MREEELLGWLVHQKRHSEIPEITDEMKDKLMRTYDHVAIIFCKIMTFKTLSNLQPYNFLISMFQQTTKMTSRISAC